MKLIPSKTLLLEADDSENTPFSKNPFGYLKKRQRNKIPLTIAGLPNWVACHLHFLADQAIETEDWFYVKEHLTIHKCKMIQPDGTIEGDNGLPYDPQYCAKVVASTDTSLNFLPYPSESFIDAYMEAYNAEGRIYDVMLEMELVQTVDLEGNVIDFYRIKTDEHNRMEVRVPRDTFMPEQVIDLMNSLIFDYIGNPLIVNSNLKVGKEWLDKKLFYVY